MWEHINSSRKLYWEVANKEPWTEDIRPDQNNTFIDIKSAKLLAANKQILARGKYIELRAQIVRELVMNNDIRLIYLERETT